VIGDAATAAKWEQLDAVGIIVRPPFGGVHVADSSNRRPPNLRQLDPGIKGGRGRPAHQWMERRRSSGGAAIPKAARRPRIDAPVTIAASKIDFISWRHHAH